MPYVFDRTKWPGPTLREVLTSLGYTLGERTNRKAQGKALHKDGALVWEGPAGDCWEWLRETGQYASQTPTPTL